MNVIEFNSVWKKFKKGEKIDSLRDTIPLLFHRALSLNNGNGLKKEEFWALKNVSFQVKKGDILGIIGPNGAGKSTTLKLLSRILEPNKGEIKIEGRLSALIEVTAGFHPELTGRENIYLNGTILGMKKKEIEGKFEKIVEFSGVKDFIDTPVKRYSSGMYSRLGFSVAAHMEPDILLVDEVLAVGDLSFQAQCAQKMRELLQGGATIVLVSHNLSLVQGLCKRVLLVNKGEIQAEGSPEEVIPYYQNIIYKKNEDELAKKMPSSSYKVSLAKEDLIAITGVSFYGKENKPKQDFAIGEALSVKIELEAFKKIEQPLFSIEILRSDGLLCCYADTKGNNSLPKIIEGKATVMIHSDEMKLAPGVYILKVSLWDKDMLHTYGIRKKDIFRIASSGYTPEANAVFLPEIKWEFKI